MLLKRFAFFALASGLTAQAVRIFLQNVERHHRARLKSQAKHELHRWENEGGNLKPPEMPAQSR